jgi:hypothetical protein
MTLEREMQRVESLIESLEKLSNPAARVVARELVQLLLTLHGTGLERMVSIARQHEEALLTAWGNDEMVGPLLLLHGLHPVPLETRVREALERVQPLLRCHGAEVELVAAAEGRVCMRLREGGTLSPQELEHTLEETFAAIAPDVQVIEIEDAKTPVRRLALPLV